jgi:hypothetical protein
MKILGREISLFGRPKKIVARQPKADWGKTPSQIVEDWSLPDGSVMFKDLNKIPLYYYEQMADDYQIKANLQIIILTLQQIDWWIDCDNKKIAQVLQDALNRVWNHTLRTFSKSYTYGYSPAEKVYMEHSKLGLIYKEIRDLKPSSCTIDTSPDGSFNGFTQKSSSGPDIKIEPDYALWYPFMMENGDWYGQKLLKSCYKPWFYSEVLHIFMNYYYERHGKPPVIGYCPEGNTEDENGIAHTNQDYMIEILRDLRYNSQVAMPSTVDEKGNRDWDIKLLEAQSKAIDFDLALKRYDMEKTRAMFSGDLVFSGGKGGSYALGQVQDNNLKIMMNSFVEDMKTYIDKFMIDKLRILNFGENSPEATFGYRKLEKMDLEAMSGILRTMVSQGTATPDLSELSTILGITIKDAVEVTGVSPKEQIDKTKEDQKAKIKETVKKDKKLSSVKLPLKGKLIDWIKLYGTKDDKAENLVNNLEEQIQSISGTSEDIVLKKIDEIYENLKIEK